MITLAKRAIKTLISDSAVRLCEGITHQGVDRRIQMISTSRLSPMPAHYAVYVSSPTSSYGKIAIRTTRPGNGQKGRLINLMIEIYDEAVMQMNEEQAFEKTNEDFDLFVDRIASLIEEEGTIVFDDGNKALLIDEGELNSIQRTDLSGSWVEDTGEVGNWYLAQLTFSLRCNCASDLY